MPHKAQGTALIGADTPNGLWCADYKGEFMLGNKQYCYPLTISNYRSLYLLACEGLEFTKSDFAFAIFERTFKDFGLPTAIRTDNGTPFAGHLVGIREVDNQVRLVSFMEYDLGFFDKEQDRVEPGPNPFAPDKVLTYVSGISCKPCDRNGPK